jgi:hypothetical protein
MNNQTCIHTHIHNPYIHTVIGVYGSPRNELTSEWNASATFDNGYKRVTADKNNYGLTGATVSVDTFGRVQRSWDDADPSMAFLIQVCMHVC